MQKIKKKNYILYLVSICLIVFMLLLTTVFVLKTGNITSLKKSYATRSAFNVDNIVNGTDGEYQYNNICFEGKVEKIEKKKISWSDSNNESYGPYERTIVKVKVDKILFGQINNNNRVSEYINILFTYDIDSVSSESVQLIKGRNYIFTNCWILDDLYYRNSNYEDSYLLNDISLKQSDVISGAIWNSVIPVENGVAFVYNEYLNNMNYAPVNAKTNAITDNTLSENDEYVPISLYDFEQIIKELRS